MPAPKDLEKREKWKEKLREAAKEQWKSLAFQELRKKVAKEQWKDPNLRKLHREKLKKQQEDPEFRAKAMKAQRRGCLKQWKDSGFREMMSYKIHLARVKDWKDPAYRKRRIESGKKQWASPGYRELHTGKNHHLWGKKLSKDQIRRSLIRRIPSSLEEKFLSIVKKCDLSYKFTGDGSFTIGHCNPDFINTNSEKIAIEVYARYYKEIDGGNVLRWKHIRRQRFSKFGWKILFFDDTQVDEENILAALEEIKVDER